MCTNIVIINCELYLNNILYVLVHSPSRAKDEFDIYIEELKSIACQEC